MWQRILSGCVGNVRRRDLDRRQRERKRLQYLQIDRQTDGIIKNTQTDIQNSKYRNGQKGRQIHKLTERRTDRQKSEQMKKQT